MSTKQGCYIKLRDCKYINVILACILARIYAITQIFVIIRVFLIIILK